MNKKILISMAIILVAIILGITIIYTSKLNYEVGYIDGVFHGRSEGQLRMCYE